MKHTANKPKSAIWILAAMLATIAFCTARGAALQTSIGATPSPNAPRFAKATVRWLLVSIPDRKLALLENGKIVRVYRVAVGKSSTPSPTGAFQIVNRVTDPSLLPQRPGHCRRQEQPGRLALDGTERKGIRNPRHEPARLNRQSGFHGMHSHEQEGSGRAL